MLTRWMNLAHNANFFVHICSTFSLKCEESLKNTEIVDFFVLIISCLWRVGTYRAFLPIVIVGLASPILVAMVTVLYIMKE